MTNDKYAEIGFTRMSSVYFELLFYLISNLSA